MKHFSHLPFFISLIFINFSVNSQLAVELSETLGGTSINGGVVNVYGASTDNSLYKTIYTKNTDTDTIDINIKRYEVGVTTGTKNTFCWGVCPTEQAAGYYSLWHNPVSIEMNPSQELGNMQAKFFPRTKAAIDTFLFVWYDVTNPNDSATVTIIFNSTGTTEIREKLINNYSLSVFPNPASEFIKVNLNEITNNKNTTIEIIDILGKTSKKLLLNQVISNDNKIDVSDLKKGLYFCKVFISEDIILTKKFIIK
jgi:hypothetical protein